MADVESLSPLTSNPHLHGRKFVIGLHQKKEQEIWADRLPMPHYDDVANRREMESNQSAWGISHPLHIVIASLALSWAVADYLDRHLSA
jgi:hypothetical protein